MAKVTFGGVDIMGDDEGNFGFARGVFPTRGRDFVQLAQSEQMLMRELATPGCQHVVELRFYAMDADTVAERLRLAYNSGVGSLTVRGYDTISNCAMVTPPPISPGRSSQKISGGTRAQAFTVSVVFQQLA